MTSSGEVTAETRTFILTNNPDGYGVDRCLADGARCGVPIATAYCQSQSFAQAKSFRRVERDEITGAVSNAARETCTGQACDNFVAIECTR